MVLCISCVAKYSVCVENHHWQVLKLAGFTPLVKLKQVTCFVPAATEDNHNISYHSSTTG